MKTLKKKFGVLKDGTAASLYVLENKNGMQAALCDYGATVVSVLVPDKNGLLQDVVLGYEDAASYEKGEVFFGACVGRNANRIAGAQFTIGETCYTLTKNDGENANHSGRDFTNKRLWNVTRFADNTVTFELKSPHLDQGFPGSAVITVTYTLTEENELKIRYEAQADADTIFNMTNHSYFNLDGSPDILKHEVTIFADAFTPTDAASIPTGEICPVGGTPMDFRTPKMIGADIDSGFIQLVQAGGYDHNWVIRGEGLRKAAVLCSRVSGIRMQVFTDLPGMQFYTGNFIGEENGKNGKIYRRRAGACFETQYFPDAVHHDSFKSTIRKAGETYDTTTSYKFDIR